MWSWNGSVGGVVGIGGWDRMVWRYTVGNKTHSMIATFGLLGL